MLIRLIVLCAILLVLAPQSQAGDPALVTAFSRLNYVTESYYPYNYIEDDRVIGISADLLREVWRQLEVPEQNIHLMPWARVCSMIRNDPGTVAFSMARTPDRETLFKWAGPISTTRFALFALKDSEIEINDIPDLKGLEIGTVRDDFADEELFRRAPFAFRHKVNDVMLNVRKLQEGRLDLIAYEADSLHRFLLAHDIDPTNFKLVYILKTVDIYYAFHKSMPESVLQSFQQSLDTIRNSEKYATILTKYGTPAKHAMNTQ